MLVTLDKIAGRVIALSAMLGTIGLIGSYFANIHKFVLPLTDYHAFYLFWWFSWSIMIGQFTSRFVGGLKTYQLFAALLVIPSIPLAIWFSVLYYFYQQGIDTRGVVNIAMIIVGVTFVINSLDSLIRLYTDNLNFQLMKKRAELELATAQKTYDNVQRFREALEKAHETYGQVPNKP